MKVSEFVALILEQKLDPEADPELVFRLHEGTQVFPVETSVSRPMIDIPGQAPFIQGFIPSTLETLTITLGRE